MTCERCPIQLACWMGLYETFKWGDAASPYRTDQAQRVKRVRSCPFCGRLILTLPDDSQEAPRKGSLCYHILRCDGPATVRPEVDGLGLSWKCWWCHAYQWKSDNYRPTFLPGLTEREYVCMVYCGGVPRTRR